MVEKGVLVKKKVLSLILAIGMTVLTACGGAGSTAETTQSSGSSEKTAVEENSAEKAWDSISTVTLYYPVYFNMPSEAGIQSVQAELDKYLEPKIGVDIELHPVDMFQYTDQINLVLSSGDQVDIFMPLAGLSTYVTKGQIIPMDDYVDEVKDAIDLMGEDFMKSSYVNGSLYSLPVYKANTFQWYFMCRKDMVEETGIDLESINSVADLEELLTKVHENHPDIYPLCPTNPNTFMLINAADGPEAEVDIDYLGDNPESCTGAVIGNTGKVENFYASDAFKEMVERAYDWNQKGLLMPEASVSPDIASDLIAAGRGFGSVIGYGYPMSEEMANRGTYGDYEMTWATCGTDLMQSSAFSNQFSLGYTSADPAAACRLMNLLWTDEYVINTIIYGLEGEDYVIPENFDPLNSMPDYPEGVTDQTAPYQARVSCGCFGNNFLMYGFGGSVKDFGMDLINNSKKSEYLGFLFDGSSVKTEITAVNNVINQYYTGLECGEMNPDETLPKFISELEAAGINTIIAEKQAQLDAWKALQ